MNSFAEQWQAAVTLTEVRGWNTDTAPGGALRVWIQDGWHARVYPRDPKGLAALLHELQRPDGRGKFKTHYLHSIGFTDPRTIYGTRT